MRINLPKPIETYFAAEPGDSEAIAKCFTENAVVEDEARIHRGKDAIKKWVVNSSKEYTFTSEPFACEEKDGKTIVTSRVSGNFPGSPLDLRYFFGLEGDKIASLEIVV